MRQRWFKERLETIVIAFEREEKLRRGKRGEEINPQSESINLRSC
jgi:hypothetical protein